MVLLNSSAFKAAVAVGLLAILLRSVFVGQHPSQGVSGGLIANSEERQRPVDTATAPAEPSLPLTQGPAPLEASLRAGADPPAADEKAAEPPLKPAAMGSRSDATGEAGAAPAGTSTPAFWPSRAPIVVPAAREHRSTLIMLHGLGDTGAGWASLAQALAAALPHTQFVFPHAPSRPITRFGGAPSTAWFDIPPADLVERRQDAAGMHESRRYVEELLQQAAAAGIPSERIVVGGFSQGAAIALLMLRSQHQLAGVLALSGFLPLPLEEPLVSEANADTPVLMCHGTEDTMISFDRAQRSADRLGAAGAKLEFKRYEGLGHSSRRDEMEDVFRFIHSRLA